MSGKNNTDSSRIAEIRFLIDFWEKIIKSSEVWQKTNRKRKLYMIWHCLFKISHILFTAWSASLTFRISAFLKKSTSKKKYTDSSRIAKHMILTGFWKNKSSSRARSDRTKNRKRKFYITWHCLFRNSFIIFTAWSAVFSLFRTFGSAFQNFQKNN